MIRLRLLSVCSIVVLALGCGQSAEEPLSNPGISAPQDGTSVAPADDSDDSTAVAETPAGDAESEHACVTLAYTDFQETVIASDRPVLIDLWATWCPPCKQLGPIIEQIAVDYQGRVVVAKMDTDENPQIVADFDVEGIPTMLFFKNGELVTRLVGLRTRDDITVQLDALLADN